jgi:NAD-dependent dihydropyrimidine dehydrogenase PreA subunit
VKPTVPREKIAWHPTVNTDVCIGDRQCYEFCRNDVFAWDEQTNHPVVQNPYKCVLGCTACAQICPVEAITFPTPQQLHEMIRQARVELEAPATSEIDAKL